MSPGVCRRWLPVWLPKLVSFANVRMDDLGCRGAPRTQPAPAYEREDIPMPLRTLHFGRQDEGPVTFLVYPPDDLVLVVRIQWLGD